ncbi:MAG: response regulator [Deltaproteobacteria bacterium]|nr:response regulator [Deltaproteobacteria bacterium]
MIDDDRFVRRLVEISLRRIGKMDVISVASGVEGLAVIGENLPDLILLDSIMPVMSGPETLKYILKSAATASIPVAFLTAASDAGAADFYRSIGAIATIRKPFIPASLVENVEQILARRRSNAAGLADVRAAVQPEISSVAA